MLFAGLGFPGGSVVKKSPANAGDSGLIPESRRSPGEGNGNPLQYSCLENPRDGEPGGLPSMGSHRVGYDWSNLAAAVAEVWNQCVDKAIPPLKLVGENFFHVSFSFWCLPVILGVAWLVRCITPISVCGHMAVFFVYLCPFLISASVILDWASLVAQW